MGIGQKIKILRKRKNYTQLELGRRLGFNESNAEARISQYEVGIRKPKKEMLKKISKQLNIPIELLIGFEDPLLNVYIELYWLFMDGTEMLIISKILDILKIIDTDRYIILEGKTKGI